MGSLFYFLVQPLNPNNQFPRLRINDDGLTDDISMLIVMLLLKPRQINNWSTVKQRVKTGVQRRPDQRRAHQYDLSTAVQIMVRVSYHLVVKAQEIEVIVM